MPTNHSVQALLNLQKTLRARHSDSKLPPVPSMEKIAGCNIKSQAPFADRRHSRSGIKFKVSDPDGSNTTHTVLVYVQSPELLQPLSKYSSINVTCNCQYHTYWGAEYSLFRYGYSELLYGNGQPPKDRNPANLPVACKHVQRVLMEVYKKKL